MYTTLFAKISYSRCIKIEIHLYPPLPQATTKKTPSFQNIKDQEKCFHGRIYSSWVCSCCLFCHPEFRLLRSRNEAPTKPQHRGNFSFSTPKARHGAGPAMPGCAVTVPQRGRGFVTSQVLLIPSQIPTAPDAPTPLPEFPSGIPGKAPRSRSTKIFQTKAPCPPELPAFSRSAGDRWCCTNAP